MPEPQKALARTQLTKTADTQHRLTIVLTENAFSKVDLHIDNRYLGNKTIIHLFNLYNYYKRPLIELESLKV